MIALNPARAARPLAPEVGGVATSGVIYYTGSYCLTSSFFSSFFTTGFGCITSTGLDSSFMTASSTFVFGADGVLV